MNHKFFASIFLLSVAALTASCQTSFDKKLQSLYKNTVPLVHPDSLVDSQNVYLLDTRAKLEFDVSHIEGAELVDYESFDLTDISHIPKDADIVVYCSVGYRSERIGEKLQTEGYKNVKNLYGGIFHWKNEGKTVINAKNQQTDSVHTYNKAWSKWLTNGVKVYE